MQKSPPRYGSAQREAEEGQSEFFRYQRVQNSQPENPKCNNNSQRMIRRTVRKVAKARSPEEERAAINLKNFAFPINNHNLAASRLMHMKQMHVAMNYRDAPRHSVDLAAPRQFEGKRKSAGKRNKSQRRAANVGEARRPSGNDSFYDPEMQQMAYAGELRDSQIQPSQIYNDETELTASGMHGTMPSMLQPMQQLRPPTEIRTDSLSKQQAASQMQPTSGMQIRSGSGSGYSVQVRVLGDEERALHARKKILNKLKAKEVPKAIKTKQMDFFGNQELVQDIVRSNGTQQSNRPYTQGHVVPRVQAALPTDQSVDNRGQAGLSNMDIDYSHYRLIAFPEPQQVLGLPPGSYSGEQVVNEKASKPSKQRSNKPVADQLASKQPRYRNPRRQLKSGQHPKQLALKDSQITMNVASDEDGSPHQDRRQKQRMEENGTKLQQEEGTPIELDSGIPYPLPSSAGQAATPKEEISVPTTDVVRQVNQMRVSVQSAQKRRSSARRSSRMPTQAEQEPDIQQVIQQMNELESRILVSFRQDEHPVPYDMSRVMSDYELQNLHPALASSKASSAYSTVVDCGGVLQSQGRMGIQPSEGPAPNPPAQRRPSKRPQLARLGSIYHDEKTSKKLDQLVSMSSNRIAQTQSQDLQELEQSYRRSRQKLIMNLGTSYNEITLDKLQKTKEAINQQRLNQVLYYQIHSETTDENGPGPNQRATGQPLNRHSTEATLLKNVVKRMEHTTSQSSQGLGYGQLHKRNIDKLETAKRLLQQLSVDEADDDQVRIESRGDPDGNFSTNKSLVQDNVSSQRQLMQYLHGKRSFGASRSYNRVAGGSMFVPADETTRAGPNSSKQLREPQSQVITYRNGTSNEMSRQNISKIESQDLLSRTRHSRNKSANQIYQKRRTRPGTKQESAINNSNFYRAGSQKTPLESHGRSAYYLNGSVAGHMSSEQRRASAKRRFSQDLQQNLNSKIAAKGKMIQLKQLVGQSCDLQQMINQETTENYDLLTKYDQVSKEQQRDEFSPAKYSELDFENKLQVRKMVKSELQPNVLTQRPQDKDQNRLIEVSDRPVVQLRGNYASTNNAYTESEGTSPISPSGVNATAKPIALDAHHQTLSYQKAKDDKRYQLDLQMMPSSEILDPKLAYGFQQKKEIEIEPLEKPKVQEQKQPDQQMKAKKTIKAKQKEGVKEQTLEQQKKPQKAKVKPKQNLEQKKMKKSASIAEKKRSRPPSSKPSQRIVNLQVKTQDLRSREEEEQQQSTIVQQSNKLLLEGFECINQRFSPRSHRSDDEDFFQLTSVKKAYNSIDIIKREITRPTKRHKALPVIAIPPQKEQSLEIQKQIRQVERNQIKRLQHEKTTRMMIKMTRNIKIANQNCRSLLSKRHEMPEVVHKKPYKIELEAGRPFFFKAEVRCLLSPLTFQIFLADEGSGKPLINDIEVYASTKVYRPSVSQYEVRFMCKNTFKVDANRIGKTNPDNNDSEIGSPTQNMEGDTEQVFLDKFLYFSLISSTGQSLSISYKQGVKHVNPLLEEFRRLEAQRILENKNIERHFTMADPYYREMCAMVARKVRDAKQFKILQHRLENKYILGQNHGLNEEQIQENLREKQLDREQRRLCALETKEQLEKEKLKMTLFKLVKNDMIKKYRIDMYVVQYKHFKRMWAIREYCKLVKAVRIYSVMAKIHKETVDYKYQEMMAKIVGSRVRQIFYAYISVRGTTLEDRTTNVIRDANSTIGMALYRVQKAKSLQILEDVFVPWIYLRCFLRKTARLCYLVRFMSRQLFNYKYVTLGRKSYIEANMWGEEFNQLITIFGKHTDPKSEAKKIKTAMPKTKQEHREFVQKAYFERQNLQNQNAFMEWYREAQEDKIEEQEIQVEDLSRKYYQYQQTIEINKEIMNAIDKFLSKGIGSKLRLAERAAKKSGGKRKTTSKGRAEKSVANKDLKGSRVLDKDAKLLLDMKKQSTGQKVRSPLSKLAAKSGLLSPTSSNEDEDVAGTLAALKVSKPMPDFVLIDPEDEPDKQAIVVRRLIVRAAILKQGEIVNFEAQLDGLNEKKREMQRSWRKNA